MLETAAKLAFQVQRQSHILQAGRGGQQVKELDGETDLVAA
jgi:hypothetical protein